MGVSKDSDVVVAFSTPVYFRKIESQLQSKGFVGGLVTLDTFLTEHIMALGDMGWLRLKGKIDHNSDMVRKHLRFGFGQIQRASYQQIWHINGTYMPGTNVKAFTQLPVHIKQ